MKRVIFGCLGVLMSFFGVANSTEAGSVNPLLKNWWDGPRGGVPPFDRVQLKDFKPALEEGMSQQRKEIDKIANNPQPPTFENTLAAMELSGQVMERVTPIYGVWGHNLSTPQFQELEKTMAPILAAFEDEIVHNQKLFKRIEAIYQSPEKSKLTPEQQRLVWVQYTHFILEGARLSEEKKVQLAKINQQLAVLSTQFSQNQLADEDHEFLTLDKKEDLESLPQSLVDGAAAEAERRNLKGKWVIANTRSSVEPFLTYSPHRALREKAFKMWASRGDNGNATDNNKVVAEILKLRFEKAKILGFETFAHWHVSNTMAKDPQSAMDLMLKVWKPAVAQAHKEVADMQVLVDQEKGRFKIAPWDYRFYSEKVRKAKYDLDFNTVKPFLQLENIRKAMFFSAEKLFGFKFKKIDGVPVFHKNVVVYEVFNAAGKKQGLWYFDPFARPGKTSGAWMTSYRRQSKMHGHEITPIVSNNSNFIQTKPGEPVLISWDDANTMFHEFGHALHGLSSKVTYPTLSGTNVPSDYVEFPSQVYEKFLETPEVLQMLTNKEGQPMPKELIEKIKKAKSFNSGFTTVEFLASAIVDMKLHMTDPEKLNLKDFERNTLTEIGMPSEIVMRHRIPHFGHLFADDYAAGYYSYLWSQVLDQDAFEAFTEASGPFDAKVARQLYDHVFSVGNSVDPAEGYRQFRGRDAKVDALLKARGFPVESSSAR